MKLFVVTALTSALAFASLGASAQDEPEPATPPGGSAPPASPPPPPADEPHDKGPDLEWVYLNAETGGSYVDMQSFSASNFGLQTTKAGGSEWGVAAGLRLFVLSVGARLREQMLSSIGNLWEIDGEAAFHMRIWQIDPYFGLRGGYTWVGSLNSQSVQVATGGAPSDVSVHGFDVGPMMGIDIYLVHFLSLGAEGQAEFLFLKRPPPPLPAGLTSAELMTAPPQVQSLYKNSGSSAGLGVIGTVHLGVHF